MNTDLYMFINFHDRLIFKVNFSFLSYWLLSVQQAATKLSLPICYEYYH